MKPRVVWKYPLYPGSPTVVSMPAGAQIIHVGSQNDGPVLFALVDPERNHRELRERRDFFVYGTGHPIVEEGLTYIGSVQVPLESVPSELVWHVFERRS